MSLARHDTLVKTQVLEKRLDEAFLLRQLLRKDARPLLAGERPCAKSVVVREELELDIAVETIADEIHQVDMNRAESLAVRH